MVATGEAAYEPNSIAPDSPRECPATGFTSIPKPYPSGETPERLRARAESFADHYSQARLFWLSMTEPEKAHLVSAFSFELGKVVRPAIRQRMLGHLQIIHADLADGVAAKLGMTGQAEAISPASPPKTAKPSPALSIIAKSEPTLQGRKIGLLITDGSDVKLLSSLRKAAKAEGATVALVAPTVTGTILSDRTVVDADQALPAGPSVLFDAVILAPSRKGTEGLLHEAAAIDWLRDAYSHLKVIGYVEAATPLFDKAAIAIGGDAGIVSLDQGKAKVQAFLSAARQQRIWEREKKVRPNPSA
jgi:catalase